MEDLRIFQIIGNYKELMEKNRKDIDYLLEMVGDFEQESSRAAGTEKSQGSGSAQSRRGSEARNVSDTLFRYEKMKKADRNLLLNMIRRLMEEREEMTRVYICFRILEEPYHAVLSMLYVEKKTVTQTADLFRRSRKSIEEYRKKAAEIIRANYDSELSNEELLKR